MTEILNEGDIVSVLCKVIVGSDKVHSAASYIATVKPVKFIEYNNKGRSFGLFPDALDRVVRRSFKVGQTVRNIKTPYADSDASAQIEYISGDHLLVRSVSFSGPRLWTAENCYVVDPES